MRGYPLLSLIKQSALYDVVQRVAHARVPVALLSPILARNISLPYIADRCPDGAVRLPKSKLRPRSFAGIHATKHKEAHHGQSTRR